MANPRPLRVKINGEIHVSALTIQLLAKEFLLWHEKQQSTSDHPKTDMTSASNLKDES